MREGRVEYGSFRAGMDKLVPLIGTGPVFLGDEPEDAPQAVVGVRGSAAYQVNQYLFEHSRR